MNAGDAIGTLGLSIILAALGLGWTIGPPLWAIASELRKLRESKEQK